MTTSPGNEHSQKGVIDNWDLVSFLKTVARIGNHRALRIASGGKLGNAQQLFGIMPPA